MRLFPAATALILILSSRTPAIGTGAAPAEDWATLWQPAAVTMPAPATVRVLGSDVGDLGEDLANRDWLMVSTARHQLYFQASADRAKVAALYPLLDGVSAFLRGRSPATPTSSIKVFLVPDERGHSRCSQIVRALRTGEQGDLAFLATSVLHEETHLFNFAVLGRKPQNWWCGEFTCIYFQQRALLESQRGDVKQELRRRVVQGPKAPLAQLVGPGQDALDEAAAAMYFLEETYGRARLNEFRRQCLEAAQAGSAGPWVEKVFQRVFGKDAAALDREWRRYFGWLPVDGANVSFILKIP
jgi:hypothetical protein